MQGMVLARQHFALGKHALVLCDGAGAGVGLWWGAEPGDGLVDGDGPPLGEAGEGVPGVVADGDGPPLDEAGEGVPGVVVDGDGPGSVSNRRCSCR